MSHDYHDEPQTRSLLDPAERAILQVLEKDWRRMCGLEIAPSDNLMSPLELNRALPHAFVLHRVAPGIARIRVAGQKLHDLMQMDPRGMPFTSFFTDDSRESAMAALEHAFATPAVVGIALTSPRGLGRKPVRAEALLLPMRDAEGNLTRMMGAIVTSGHLPTRPVRFDVLKDAPMRTEVLQAGHAERRAWRGKNPYATETAAAVFTHHARHVPAAAPMPHIAVQHEGRAGLRLVVDNTI